MLLKSDATELGASSAYLVSSGDFSSTPPPQSKLHSILGMSILEHLFEERHLFETEMGYIGMGPQDLQDGDYVCVLAGGKVPFALRKVNEFYRLVDGCFMMGFMDGEAMLKYSKTLSIGEIEIH